MEPFPRRHVHSRVLMQDGTEWIVKPIMADQIRYEREARGRGWPPASEGMFLFEAYRTWAASIRTRQPGVAEDFSLWLSQLDQIDQVSDQGEEIAWRDGQPYLLTSGDEFAVQVREDPTPPAP